MSDIFVKNMSSTLGKDYFCRKSDNFIFCFGQLMSSGLCGKY